MKPDEPNDDGLDPALTQRSRAVFDEAVNNLDAATRSRLNQSRQAALAAQHPRGLPLRWWLPTGSVAAVLLATVVSVHFWQSQHTPAAVATPSVAATQVDDLELLTADADPDMLKDLDFYAWLDTQDMTAIDAGEAG